MKIAVTKLHPEAILPSYQTAGAAGMDLHARLDKPVILEPGERALIPTGLAIALPSGYEAQVRARSGLAIKHGITMINGVGTIDADYRGEVGALVVNLGQEPFVIETGERIAQLIIARYETVSWNLVEDLDDTVRGQGGFGSTGRA